MGKVGVGFLLFVGIIVLLVVSAIANGWVLAILWGWFIIPVFALPALSIPQAIGIGMVVSYLTYQYTNDDKETDWAHSISTTIMRPLVALGIGYIVTLFM